MSDVLSRREAAARIFGLSFAVTLAVVAAVWWLRGWREALTVLVLTVVEVVFSFDNAVVNAKLLGQLSAAWQRMFLTVGLLIAVLGMRLVFPVAIVAVGAHLPWARVLDLALHHPDQYADRLIAAHPAIAAFGGMFLLLLALQFFLDSERRVLWIRRFEEPLQHVATIWLPAVVSLAVLGVVVALPADHHQRVVLGAGLAGVLTFIAMQVVTALFGAGTEGGRHGRRTGWAAFWLFVYLETLDASFSFDGVMGAFAITSAVLLIAAGLGVGAFWVRSLTVYMTKRGTLKRYIYLEHGAHYTILVLAVLLLVSIFADVPDAVAGTVGLAFIGASLAASRKVAVAK